MTYLQFRNEGLPEHVRILWEKRSKDGRTRRRSKQIRVGTAERYRTWSRTPSLSPGKYSCIVETLEGERISQLEFEVKAFDASEAALYHDEHGA